MSAGGWTRAARGLRLVAADGAARISSAAVSSNAAAKHLPELAASIARAGGVGGGRRASAPVVRPPDASVSRRGDGDFARRERPRPVDPAAAETDRTEGAPGKNGEKDDAGVGGENSIRSSFGMAAPYMSDRDIYSKPHDMSSDAHGKPMPPNDDQTRAAPAPFRNPPPEQSAEGRDDDRRPRHLPEGTAVPATRLSRALGFASLGAGLAAGTVSELARRALGRSEAGPDRGPPVSNDANARRLAESLRRMRGAAMKLGQMLSIQDESIAPPALTNALAQVRKGAEAMPSGQLLQQLEDQWGEGWKDRIDLEERPFAAASIGQVHRGTLVSPSTSTGMAKGAKVAVKVQYPGVADSIESDLSNLSMLVNATGLAPPGLFLDNVIRVGREELKTECDYKRELANQQRFQSLISSDPSLLADRFVVPQVIEELSTDRILVSELVRGGTIDKVVNLDQSERNRIGKAIMRLTMLELFVWRFMQTDPNWGNFLYDVRTRTTYLIDFGAAREYDAEFVKGYLNIVVANANRDEEALMKESIRMGFLTGEENDTMMEAHKLSGYCLGEPFQSHEPYDFKASRITSRISEHGSVFLKHRLTPPPEEVYTLHRKLAGAYNLCIKLGAIVSCRDLLDEVVAHNNGLIPNGDS